MWRIVFILSLPILALGMIGHTHAETYTVDGAVKPAGSLPPPEQAPAPAGKTSKSGKHIDEPRPLASNVAVDPSTGRVIGSSGGSMGGDISGPMGDGSQSYETAAPSAPSRTGKQLAPMAGGDPDELLKKKR